MKKKKLFTLVAAVSLVAVIGVGSTLAYFTDSDSAKNVVTMGHVDITLTEPEFSKNEDNTISNVVPNQVITKDPTITVAEDSESCYLRAKIDFSDDLTDMQAEELLAKIEIKDGWVLSTDGYYYYQNIVEKTAENKEVVFFDKVTIPELWGNEVADLTFEINVTAEAIQADNFEPREVNGVYGWYTSEDVAVTAETYSLPTPDSEPEVPVE